MMIVDPKSYNKPARPTLHEGDTGHLGAAVLALTREVWVLTDRLAVLEAVLATHGIDAASAIEAYQPDAELQAALDAKGQRLVASVVNALAGITAE
jgi:hypothetical protein